MISKLIAWCIDNRFLVVTLSVIVTAIGVWSTATIPVDAMPDLSDVQVIIHTKWQGRDPQTIEDQVTYPLATAMLAVPGVADVRGASMNGDSFVYVIFDDNTDPYWARSRVLEYLNQVQGQLPVGVTPSLGPDASGLGWVFMYTLEDTQNRYDLGELRAIQDWYVRFQLTAVPGVAEVATVGGAVRQYQIAVDPRRLLLYNISLKQVVASIKDSNLDVGGRVIEVTETEQMIRGRGYIRGVHDLEKIVLTASDDGTPVLVKDVATVQIGPDMKRGIAEKDGKGNVVAGIVVMRYGENALDVINAVKEKIRQLEPGLPEGVVIRTGYDRSGLIHRSINTLKVTLTEELAITTLICLMFLFHVRSALVAAIVLPLGILMAFIVMNLIGVGANIMSLAGIAVAVGTMVDASVVMVENLHKHKETAPPDASHWELVTRSAQEVGPGLFASLLVVTVSFLPVFVLQGQAGRLFKPLAFTKTFSMAAAAIIAVTLVPVLLGFFVRGRLKPENKNPLNRLMIWIYLPLLRFALRHKIISILIALGVLAVTLVPLGKLGSEFMPPLREGDILYMPTTVPGLSVTEARRTLQMQDAMLSQFPEVKSVLGKMGRSTTPTDPAPLNMVETHVMLREKPDWPLRLIQKGYIRKTSRRMLADGKRVDSHFDEQDAEEQWAADLLRRKMIQIRPSLPARIVEQSARTLVEILISQGGLSKDREQAAVLHLTDGWKDRISAAELPMVRTTFDELTKEEMQRTITIPGMPNWWLMPIETRIGMLTTGMRGQVGLKLYGTDLARLAEVSVKLEEVLRRVPGTASVVAERAMGGHYLDIEVDRDECARYGLKVGDVQRVIESAIGGMNIGTTVEGRFRFPINVRYPPELRDDPEKLKRILVTTPNGVQIPLGHVTRIQFNDGPPVIKSESGLLVSNIPVALDSNVDIGGYVKRAQAEIDRALAGGELTMPPGYYTKWSGQYEFMQQVRERLKIIVPITLALIFILIFWNMGNVTETLITMGTLPFALIGGVWGMYWLGYNWSVAVAIGFIALAGLAAETGIIMHVYLDLAYKKHRKEKGRALTPDELEEAVIDGAVLRVRPKLMTVLTDFLALLPILWATTAGAGPMKRIAIPVIGGVITSAVHTLILIPVYYALYKRWEQWRHTATDGEGGPDADLA